MLMTTEKFSYVKRLSDAPAPAAWPCRIIQQVDVSYDPRFRMLWTYMKPIGIPCFNQNMIEELHHLFSEMHSHQGQTVCGH